MLAKITFWKDVDRKTKNQSEFYKNSVIKKIGTDKDTDKKCLFGFYILILQIQRNQEIKFIIANAIYYESLFSRTFIM